MTKDQIIKAIAGLSTDDRRAVAQAANDPVPFTYGRTLYSAADLWESLAGFLHELLRNPAPPVSEWVTADDAFQAVLRFSNTGETVLENTKVPAIAGRLFAIAKGWEELDGERANAAHRFARMLLGEEVG